MRYRIISVGKIREKFYRQGMEEYLKRLRPYQKIDLEEGFEEKLNPNASEKEIEKLLDKEAEKIMSLVTADEVLVVLDIDGEMLDSLEIAEKIKYWNESGKKRVNFVIGGSYGIAPQVKKRADLRISFSPLTFPHQMAVLILVEQIYRGFRIIRGEPYHK